MPDMNYSSGPGGYLLETSGSPGVGAQGYAPGGNEDLINFYKEMARRRPVAAAPAMMGGPAQPQQPAYAPQGRDSSSNLPDEMFKQAQQRDAILQMQARQNGAPMRGVTGPGMIGSAGGQDTMDVNAMNAYQRQAYLPQGSSQVNTPANAAAAQTSFDEEARWRQGMAGDRARTAGMAGEVGGAAPGTPGGTVTPRGTAPMLTPANASVPMAQGGGMMDPYERIRRASLNAQYGR